MDTSGSGQWARVRTEAGAKAFLAEKRMDAERRREREERSAQFWRSVRSWLGAWRRRIGRR